MNRPNDAVEFLHLDNFDIRGEIGNTLTYRRHNREAQSEQEWHSVEGVTFIYTGQLTSQTELEISKFVIARSKPEHSDLFDRSTYLTLSDGYFVGVLIDPHKNYFVIVTPRFGYRKIYFRVEHEIVCISTRLIDGLLRRSKPSSTRSILRHLMLYRLSGLEESVVDGVFQARSCELVAFYDTCDSKWEWTRKRFPPLIERQRDLSDLSVAVPSIGHELKEVMIEDLRNSSGVAVLLSGGVDSSLLAALLVEAKIEFTAISFRLSSSFTVELENAKRFADALGVPHEVIEVPEDDLSSLLRETVRIAEQPVRTQSSVAVLSMLKSLTGRFSHVVYGESADTLFGTQCVVRFRRMKKKNAIFRLLGISTILNLLAGLKRFEMYKNFSVSRVYWAEQELELTDYDRTSFGIGRGVDVDTPPYPGKFLGKHSDMQNQILLEGVSDMFHISSSLAQEYGIQLCYPFARKPVVVLAERLSKELFGADESVKLVLKELCASYFGREIVFAKKMGFPVPYGDWLTGPLAADVQALTDELGLKLDSLSLEMQWTLTNLNALGLVQGNLPRLKPNA